MSCYSFSVFKRRYAGDFLEGLAKVPVIPVAYRLCNLVHLHGIVSKQLFGLLNSHTRNILGKGLPCHIAEQPAEIGLVHIKGILNILQGYSL